MIGDKVFIIEVTGVEWGGAEAVAFESREKAQAWLDEAHPKDSALYSDDYEIKEVVIQ